MELDGVGARWTELARVGRSWREWTEVSWRQLDGVGAGVGRGWGEVDGVGASWTELARVEGVVASWHELDRVGASWTELTRDWRSWKSELEVGVGS